MNPIPNLIINLPQYSTTLSYTMQWFTHSQGWLSKEPSGIKVSHRYYWCASFSMILGENNSGYNRDKYNCTFPKMIESWRAIWYNRTNSITDPTFPFGFVQVRASLVRNVTSSIISSLASNIWHNRYEDWRVSMDSVASNIWCWLCTQQCCTKCFHGSRFRSPWWWKRVRIYFFF